MAGQYVGGRGDCAVRRAPYAGRGAHYQHRVRVQYPGAVCWAQPLRGHEGRPGGLPRGWARDLAPRRITVNVIQPGLIETDLLPTDAATVATLLAPIPLGRFGTVDEVGQVVAFLASDAASYITGATLNVDGGWSI